MPKKILVIDDDITHTVKLAQTLKENAYSVTFSHPKNPVYPLLDIDKPDLVVLDIICSHTCGLSEYLSYNTIPFIFTCNGDGNGHIEKAYQQGASNLLLKPINAQQLIIEIETALHWHWEKQQLNRRKENIDKTINNNRKISVAIGIVMERYQIKGPDAFEILRSSARNKQHRIVDIAEKIIDAHERPLPNIYAEKPSRQNDNNASNLLTLEHFLNDIQLLID